MKTDWLVIFSQWLFISLSHLQKLLLVLGAILKLECLKMLPEMKINIKRKDSR